MGSAVFVLLALATCWCVRVWCVSRFDTIWKRVIFYIPCCFLVFFVFFSLAYFSIPSVRDELSLDRIQRVIFFLTVGIFLSSFDLLRNGGSSSG